HDDPGEEDPFRARLALEFFEIVAEQRTGDRKDQGSIFDAGVEVEFVNVVMERVLPPEQFVWRGGGGPLGGSDVGNQFRLLVWHVKPRVVRVDADDLITAAPSSSGEPARAPATLLPAARPPALSPTPAAAGHHLPALGSSTGSCRAPV